MGVAEVRRLRILEEENRKLKQLVADLRLDKQMLQDVCQWRGDSGPCSGGKVGAGGIPVPRDGAAGPEKTPSSSRSATGQGCGGSSNGASPKVGGEFVAAMEDVLDLYAEPYDPKRPVCCFDETSTQLLAESRAPQPAGPRMSQASGLRIRDGWYPQSVPVLPASAGAGAMLRLTNGTPCRILPTGCAGWWMRPTPMSRWYAWCWTT